jgi:hypothetical protein
MYVIQRKVWLPEKKVTRPKQKRAKRKGTIYLKMFLQGVGKCLLGTGVWERGVGSWGMALQLGRSALQGVWSSSLTSEIEPILQDQKLAPRGHICGASDMHWACTMSWNSDSLHGLGKALFVWSGW